jgi:hypothetical protein
LAYLYQRSGNLWLPIGVHAGGIAWMKFFKTITLPVPGAATGLWGHSFVIDGWFAVAVLVAAVAIAPRLMSVFFPDPLTSSLAVQKTRARSEFSKSQTCGRG